MAIPTPPAAPNPLGTNFAAEALAFTQWMQAAAPEFNTAVTDANAAVGDAEQAVLDAAAQVGLATTQAGSASASATTASGHATAADTARANAVIAKDAAEDARDMSQTYAALAGASAGLPALAGQALKQLQVKADESGVQWMVPVAGAANIVRAEKTSAYTLTGADKGALIDCTGTWTLGFDAAATLGTGWWCYVRNTGSGDITIDPNGSELIDGASTLVMKPGLIYLLQCDGVAFTTVTVKRRTYERRSLITASGTFTVPEDCFVIRAYAFGAGGGPVGANGAGGGGCAYGDVAVVPGQVVTLGIASGIATVTASAVALLTANPASGATGGTASKHASVTNGGAYSGGTTPGGGYSAGASSGSPLGNGFGGGVYGGAGWGGIGGDSLGTASAGGGAAGAASSSAQSGGSGFDSVLKPTDPLLADLTGVGGVTSAPGGPGGGGGGGGSGFPGGNGGFGGGGGGTSLASAAGGNGGFGGGGGFGTGTGGTGGNGGYGGGGGRGSSTNGAGGPAAIIIIY